MLLRIVVAISCYAAGSRTQAQEIDSEQIRVGKLLTIGRVTESGRKPVFRDAIEAMRVANSWVAPQAGTAVTLTDGQEKQWQEADWDLQEDGWYKGPGLNGGYAWLEVESDREQVVWFAARGHRHVYINNEPRVGDLYNLNMVRIPVSLRKGKNDFLFKGGRGNLQLRFDEIPGELFWNSQDMTLPDLIIGESETVFLGVILVNAADTWREGLNIRARAGDGPTETTGVPPLPPLSFRKLAVRLQPPAELAGVKQVTARLEVVGASEIYAEFDLAVRAPDEKHKRTFVSQIDNSVQYYAVTPAQPGHAAKAHRPALFLSLHGASVQATNQAFSYGHKHWGVVVAPTNRRPFGFDWEDWGRLDAMEVLELAEERFQTDPNRTYLTGHSMGGHGTWSLGAHFPGRFAAIAPSAGWRDFWSYGGAHAWGDSTEIERMMSRAANASRTLLLERNYLQGGVYILHGDKDNNVPVDQARFMRQRLAKYHPNWAYYERPGAGHWWGNQCMDWPPLFAFLKDNVRPADGDQLQFTFHTVNPAISSECYWLEVIRQEKPLDLSRVDVVCDLGKNKISLKTKNIARLSLDLSVFAEDAFANAAEITVEIDQFKIAFPTSRGKKFYRKTLDGNWKLSKESVAGKNPRRNGPFKDAFRNRMIFVVGTQGGAEENAWAFAKARFDAEMFWYRGNGAVEIVRDVDFDPQAEPDRNVILYGHKNSISVWHDLMTTMSLEPCEDGTLLHYRGLRENSSRSLSKKEMAFLYLQPRAHSDTASVAAIGGTSLPAMRVTDALPYFVSGVHYPDWILLHDDVYETGVEGIYGCGFFGANWSLSKDEEAWAP